MALPVVGYYLVFFYWPMYGAVIAFQNYSPMKGIWGSDWVGLDHFVHFMNGHYFWRLIRNTLMLSLYSLLFGFTAPIILALLLNEVRNRFLKNFLQTVSYLPYFISLIVVCELIRVFTESGSPINLLYSYLSGSSGQDMLQQPNLFRSIYVSSEIWQQSGWESIIYLAALTGIDPKQYEAARIDGAGRLRQIVSITLPGLAPTIIIMLILRLGHLLEVSYEKIILLYNPVNYETADVISTYVYRKGLIDNDWSFSSAVGLFNSLINLTVLVLANAISRKFSGKSLW
ncbi:sugar ABC transporter permease [Paenibacillus sp. JW14]|uniref:Sugar ABC transporter permease n=2 Tax=Paenibacillus agri TaxID=2744309 RepID=A0A850EH16_9BACL|nr:sugar ABC transporter permease [Paenibacillus agri]